MADTTKTAVRSTRDIYYYRRRLKNRIFARLASFFAEEARRAGITKKDLATRLDKDPAQITRWLSGPSNLTLDTLSDLLLAMGAEADPPEFVRFSDRAKPNYVHPLIASVTGIAPPADSKSSAGLAYADLTANDISVVSTNNSSTSSTDLALETS